jgi:hypothetical protein
MTEEEDSKMTDRWQKDGDGILIFVSLYLRLHAGVANVNIAVDRSIRCCPRSIAHGLRSRPQAKSAGHLCSYILSRKHLSTSRRPECISCINPCHSSSTTPIFSTEISNLGQLTLVPQFGHRSNMCPTGNNVTTVGTSIRHNHSPATL